MLRASIVSIVITITPTGLAEPFEVGLGAGSVGFADLIVDSVLVGVDCSAGGALTGSCGVGAGLGDPSGVFGSG